MKVSKLLVPLVVGGLALTLAACGGPVSTPSAGASSGGSAAPVADAGWDINEMARDQLTGGEFTGSISHPISTWNVTSVEGNDAELTPLQSPISPIYYSYTGAGDPIMSKDFLVSAEPVVTAGKLVVTMKLNPTAVWNDGEVIGADDWIATWKALNGSNEKFTAASTDGWTQIETVAAGADQQEVIVTFKTTYPDWIAVVADGPLRAEGATTPEVFNDGWKEYKAEYFTGPFKVENWDKTSGNVTMVPNEKWWGEKPLLTKLTWKQIASDGLAAAFANQELDYYDIGADPDGYSQASNAQNSKVRVAAGPNFRHFTFNTKAPFLDDLNVRQAIVMGLDRTIIAKSDLAGLPGDQVPLNNNLYVSNQTGYVDQGKATGIDFDVDGAKGKLDAAGWMLDEASGFRKKDGKQLDVEFAVLGGVSASENEGLQAQKMLKDIGVNLKLRTVDVNKDWPGVLIEHKFGIVAFSWIGTPYPLRNIGQIYGGTTKDGKFAANESNFAQLDITKVNELLPAIDTEMDAAKRAELGNQAAQEIWTQVHTLPLYQRPMLIGVREKLANIGALGMARYPIWQNVGFTK